VNSTVALVDIKIGERFRKIYNNIDELAASIEKYGLLHPPVVDRELNLVAGGRRVLALQKLGRETIEVAFRDELDPLTARELELEENIQREDLTWQERILLVSEIDRLKRQLYGSDVQKHAASLGWDSTDTAEALGVSQPTVSRDLALGRMIEVMPEIAQAPDKLTAIRMFNKRLEVLERELSIRQQDQVDENFVCGDSLVLIQEIPTNSIDLIVSDPPYGIDLDSSNLGKQDAAHFADTTLNTFRQIAPELRRVLKPDGHAYFFCAVAGLTEMFEILTANGFDTDPIPLIWCKNMGGLVDFAHRYVPAYEQIIYCPGDKTRSLKQRMLNWFRIDAVSTAARVNRAEKPVELMQVLIQQSSIEGEIVYDPFAGRAPVLIAAKLLGRKYLGSELDPVQHTAGQLTLVGLSSADTPEQPETDVLFDEDNLA
jgi:site-specific DNA-methyltransferase (adenine-specific)